ncbi:MAG TPA: hypothetical protein VIQ31_33930, partial [Phormidium sp.]
EPQRRRERRGEEKEKFIQLELLPSEPIYKVAESAEVRVDESANNQGKSEISYSKESRKSRKKNVTKRVADSSPKWGVDNPETPED